MSKDAEWRKMEASARGLAIDGCYKNEGCIHGSRVDPMGALWTCRSARARNYPDTTQQWLAGPARHHTNLQSSVVFPITNFAVKWLRNGST